MNKPAIVGFILIILLVVSVVIPAVSKQIMVNKEKMLESNPEQGDSRLLATLRMDFGEDIYNDKVKYYTKFWNPPRKYHVDLNINFECPSNRKVEVNYKVEASLYEIHGWELYFFEFEDSVTIINGSNPPDIDDTYVRSVPTQRWTLYLLLRAELTSYKYYEGEWVKNNEDDTEIEKFIRFTVFESRFSARTYHNENKEFDLRITNPFMRLIERFPNMSPILRHLLRL
jgi:hypothetical protein